MKEAEQKATALFKMGLCQQPLKHHGIAAQFSARDCEQCFVPVVAAALGAARDAAYVRGLERAIELIDGLPDGIECSDAIQAELAKAKGDKK